MADPKMPEPQDTGPCRKSQDQEHLWDVRRVKELNGLVYGFFQCLLCRNDTMTIKRP
jgi:hypothetical protein